MGAKLIIRVRSDDRIEVRVEGLAKLDRLKPQGQKMCEKITRRLEHDLGRVEQREYEGVSQQDIQLSEEYGLRLGED